MAGGDGCGGAGACCTKIRQSVRYPLIHPAFLGRKRLTAKKCLMKKWKGKERKGCWDLFKLIHLVNNEFFQRNRIDEEVAQCGG